MIMLGCFVYAACKRQQRDESSGDSAYADVDALHTVRQV